MAIGIATIIGVLFLAGQVATAQLPGRGAQLATDYPYCIMFLNDTEYTYIPCPDTPEPTLTPSYTPNPSATPSATVTPSSTPIVPTATPTIEPPPTQEHWVCTAFPWLDLNIRNGIWGSVIAKFWNYEDMQHNPPYVAVETIRLYARQVDTAGVYWYAFSLKPGVWGWVHGDYLKFDYMPPCETLPKFPDTTQIYPPVVAGFGMHEVIPINPGETTELVSLNADLIQRRIYLIVKSVHAPEYVSFILANGGIPILRSKVGSGYLQDCTRPYKLTPAQAVQEQLDRHMQHYANVDPRAWIEIDNECAEYWDNLEWLDSYLSLLIKRVRTEYGRTLVVLSPLAGDYTEWRVRRLTKTWDAMIKYGAVLGMHGYGITHGLYEALSVGYLEPFVRQHVQVMNTLKDINPAYGAIRIVYTEAGSTTGWDPFRPDDCARWYNVIKNDPGIVGIACWTGGSGTAVYSASGRYSEIIPYLD